MSELTLDKRQLNQLYQYAMTLTQHPHNAYDLLQSSLETYWARLQQGQAIQHAEAYLRTLIHNRFIDDYRKQQRWQLEPYEELSVHDISPLDLEALHIRQDQLDQVWNTLSADERAVLYYWAVLGYSTDEACGELGIARGTFLSRLHRLRKRLAASRNDLQGSVKETSG